MAIKDQEIAKELKKITKRIDSIQSTKPLKKTATLEDVISAVNKITDSLKR